MKGALAALVMGAALVSAPLGQTNRTMSGPIGYVGCSNTRMAVEGYRAVGGTNMWPTPGGVYNGGTAPRWASGAYWGQYAQLRSAGGEPAAIWFQVCLLANESNLHADIAAAVKVLLDLADRTTAPVYVSAINGYSDHACKLTGGDGPAKAQAVADWVVAHGLASTGPQMPALSITQTRGDGCHPNALGQPLLGRVLLDFFG